MKTPGLILSFILLLSFQSLAQDKITVTGQIRDVDGDPMPGINVIEKGTTNGTTTDAEGNYELEVDSDATLMFSSIGYATIEIPVEGHKVINFQFNANISVWCCTNHDDTHCDTDRKRLRDEYECDSFQLK